MDDANRSTKTTLSQFKPTFQAKYILLQQLDSLAKKKWNVLLITKPKVPDVNNTQEFVACTLILARKW